MEIILGVNSGNPEEEGWNGRGLKRSDFIKKPIDKFQLCRLTNLLEKPCFLGVTPLYHLKGRYTPRYVKDIMVLDTESDLLTMTLELLNRRGVRETLKPLKGVTHLAPYFFEQVGSVNPALRLCVQCGDEGKRRGSVDRYFVDLVEVTANRTILCSQCMMSLVRMNINNVDGRDELLNELHLLREQQTDGIVVDPFLITCGY